MASINQQHTPQQQQRQVIMESPMNQQQQHYSSSILYKHKVNSYIHFKHANSTPTTQLSCNSHT